MDLAISVDSLLRLPSGASYHKRSGQAGAEVTLKGDTVFVRATCDSLQREVEYYEERYHAALEALDSLKENIRTREEQRQEPLADPVVTFIMGLAGGALATATIFIANNRYGKKQ